jgi:DOPA 4,5-dioxygenase
MAERFVDPGAIQGYHAHIYYDAETRPIAERLREAIGNRFGVELGRWRDEPVGPHPVPMYQAAFPAAEFPRIVPWLMLNRGALSVLVHPQTEDAYTTTRSTRCGWALPCRCALKGYGAAVTESPPKFDRRPAG